MEEELIAFLIQLELIFTQILPCFIIVIVLVTFFLLHDCLLFKLVGIDDFFDCAWLVGFFLFLYFFEAFEHISYMYSVLI